MTSRLSIYNEALLYAGERALSSLTENREPRYLLDNVFNNGGIDYCLEQAQWFFAMRTIQIDYDTDIETPFGYRRGFSKPDDWIITSALCSDEYFREPLTRYVDEAGYWYADEDTVYVRYVSNDSNYGSDLNRWPESFKEFVAAHFAFKAGMKISNSDGRAKTMFDLRRILLNEAKNKCAMASATQFSPRGSWTRSRASNSGRRDGGNRNSLIG